ncbi:uncharacterized protein RJT20DRAFT_129008 [Scheffersomyces xylosifermentans]|uniref:uncharacterized protein n=1 Tax=Scheffersomyces xylosifermentans TaxID=1304137 RepID=UPI00315C84BC
MFSIRLKVHFWIILPLLGILPWLLFDLIGRLLTLQSVILLHLRLFCHLSFMLEFCFIRQVNKVVLIYILFFSLPTLQ